MASQLWGDCHTHSHYSDGLFPVAVQSRFYEAFGNDYRFQTDHHIVAVPEGKPATKWLHAAQWPAYVEDCRKGTSAGHLCIPGVELGWQIAAERAASEHWFHTKLHPPAGQPVPDESFYAGKTYLEMLRACKEAGYRMIVAHVDQGAPLHLMSGAEIHGLELRSDIEEDRPILGRPTLKEWDRMLTAGHAVSVSGGSDSHQPDQWAGSALRTVVLDTLRDPDAIVDAVVAGRSYLSATWHPDCYAAAGWPEHRNPVTGGQTRFWPWWDFKTLPGLKERDPEQIVEEGFESALKMGRCRREDYPVLEEFLVCGATCGGAVSPVAHAPVRVAWRTHVPLRVLRLVGNGRSVLELPAGDPRLRQTTDVLEADLDLRGLKYLRLELEACAPGDAAQRETLLGNPVYVRE